MSDNNFIVVSERIGGAGYLKHGTKDKSDVDKYGIRSFEKTYLDRFNLRYCFCIANQ